jgi:hypothetical protein
MSCIKNCSLIERSDINLYFILVGTLAKRAIRGLDTCPYILTLFFTAPFDPDLFPVSVPDLHAYNVCTVRISSSSCLPMPRDKIIDTLENVSGQRYCEKPLSKQQAMYSVLRRKK